MCSLTLQILILLIPAAQAIRTNIILIFIEFRTKLLRIILKDAIGT